MPPQSIANSCIPKGAVVPPPQFTPGIFSGERFEAVTRCRHRRRSSYDIENLHHHDRDAPVNTKKERRRTANYRLARPSLVPWGDSAQPIARILPQRIITPRSTTTEVQSIWFQSPIEHPDFGVSLADIVDEGVEKPMVASEDRVFQSFGLNCEEIQFSILWPGYGHISWIASIPINLCKGSGYQRGPITRRLLASTVARHFRAFMTNHSYLRFPNSDPSWRIMNEKQNGISFDNLRLTRLFGRRDETGKLCSWQAEILVVYYSPTHTH